MQSKFFTMVYTGDYLHLSAPFLFDVFIYPGGVCQITDLDLSAIDLTLFGAMIREAREIGLLYFGNEWSKSNDTN